jgi:hypothetical protein
MSKKTTARMTTTRMQVTETVRMRGKMKMMKRRVRKRKNKRKEGDDTISATALTLSEGCLMKKASKERDLLEESYNT